MLQFESEQQRVHRAVKSRVMAGMETGNFDAARTALREYGATNPSEAGAIRIDVVSVYGTGL